MRILAFKMQKPKWSIQWMDLVEDWAQVKKEISELESK